MRILSILLVLIAFLSVPARAEESDRLIELLKTPGHVLLIRHAYAPGNGDPANFDVEDCSTQRNLDQRGRAQAREIGEWLRKRRIAPVAVWSSPWCRCMDTAAEMDLGPVEPHAGLESFYGNYPVRDRVMRDFGGLMRELEQTDAAPNILITHQVVISAATGEFTSSGEGIVARIDAKGALTALGSLDFGERGW